MKMFNLKKMIAYVLVAMLTLGVFSVNASAAEYEVSREEYEAAVAAAQAAGIKLDSKTQAKLQAIVKEAADSLDIVEEGVDPSKSTFVSFAEHPVKIVKYDGKAHGLRGVAVKTIGYDYVADTENLYVGMTAAGRVYQSFNKPVEPGFYYVVCMYAGDANNYPSVGYGILVILPACECGPDCDGDHPTTEKDDPTTTTAKEDPTTTEKEDPTTTTAKENPTTTEDVEKPTTTEKGNDPTTEAPTEAPEVPTDATTAQKEAPKTGDTTQIMTYVAAMVVALGAMAVILFRKKNA